LTHFHPLDTLDHDTLIRRLKHSFGLTGPVLQWIESYLVGRRQFVRVGQQKSMTEFCEYGVPQGSVLGPLFFTLYVAPTANIIDHHNVRHAQYADDTQLFVALESDISLSDVNRCFCSLQRWFDINGLSLNPDKSEAIIFGTAARHRVEGGSIDSITLNNNTQIPVSKSVKSLGVVLDNSLSFDKHIEHVCKSANYHLRALRHIRKYLSTDDAATVATAMISSRLDYCNAVLHGISAKNIAKLQRIQNTLARSVSCSRRRDHIAPVLADLHWLPIAARIEFKIALLTFKTLTTQQPAYLHELLQIHSSGRQTRSSDHNFLAVNRVHTEFASRAFCHAAPTIWNCLPTNLTDDLNCSVAVFKRKLKTVLFSRSFPN